MTRFFVRSDQIRGDIVTLEADDAHHLRAVLHAAPGQKIAVLDGLGSEYPALLLEIGKSRAVARIDAPFSPETEPQTQITMAQALPKVAEKIEQVLQRGTEIGAVEFRVFQSARSLIHLTGERQTKRLARWQAIIKTAAEQSHRAVLPTLRVAEEFQEIMNSVGSYDLALLAHAGEAPITLRAALETCPRPPRSILVMVGPEGGFAEAEAQAARKSGIPLVSLGPRILRTETAPLVLLSQILFALETSPVR